MADDNPFRSFLNPIVAIATVILGGVLFLILSAIVGWDRGVLAGMAKVEYARGLITYLFAVVTIGTAVLLVVSALTSPADESHEKVFQRGKEILSLLLGVFGTIVGFYFGSEAARGAMPLAIAPLQVSSQTVVPKGQITLKTFVYGGHAPYKYSVGFDHAPQTPTEPVDNNGWIQSSVNAPEKEGATILEVLTQDLDGHVAEQSEKITVAATPPK
jgi:hypothetical protein